MPREDFNAEESEPIFDYRECDILRDRALDEWIARPISRLMAGKWARAAAAEKAAAAGTIRREGAWNVVPGIAILRRNEAKHKTRTVPALCLVGRGSQKIVRDTRRRVVLRIRDNRRGVLFEDDRFVRFERAPMPRRHGGKRWHAEKAVEDRPYRFRYLFEEANDERLTAEAKRRWIALEMSRKIEQERERREREEREREKREFAEQQAAVHEYIFAKSRAERAVLFAKLPQGMKASECLGIVAGERTSARSKVRTMLALGIVAG